MKNTKKYKAILLTPKKCGVEPETNLAIQIIEQAIEPWLDIGINGEKYYHLESLITSVIKSNLKLKDIKP